MCNLIDRYPAVVNPPTETNHIIRLAKKHLGEEHFSSEDLPLLAGEDFSYYLKEKPGCFFTLGTMKEGSKQTNLHETGYDYNDNMISTGAYFYIRIVEDRLGLTILPDENNFMAK